MTKIDYENNIINLTASILSYYNCFIEYKTLDIANKYLNKDYNHVILIVLDGLGINILNNLSEESLLKKNLKHTIDSVFPPTTVAATTAILSGKPPFSSGHLGWTQYNKFEDKNVVVFKNETTDGKRTKLKTNLKEDYLHYDDIISKIQKRNKNLHVEAVYPNFHPEGYETFDEQLDRLLMITKKERSFSYCYFDEPDMTIHMSGVNGTKTKSILKTLNASYERFLREISDDVLVIVTADHGLTNINNIKLFEYPDIINTFKQEPSVESRALTFFIKDGEHEVFKELFDKYFQPGFMLLSKEQLYESNLLGYGIKHELLDSFIGDYMAISISDKAFQLTRGKPFLAHHAGLKEEEIKVPVIINK